MPGPPQARVADMHTGPCTMGSPLPSRGEAALLIVRRGVVPLTPATSGGIVTASSPHSETTRRGAPTAI